MYQVLYRKYRPRFFSDVKGQDQVTTTLCNELQSGRIAHAYLFTGSRGTGKTTCAKILAKAVNCLQPENGNPCGECEICRGLDDGSVMDVMEIDAASNNGVDSIRTLIEETNFTPAHAQYRVYIIDEVHMLSTAAFNALLKTLEEPPPHVIFILATTEVHRLLPTILSRCQRFDFQRIPPEAIVARITEVTVSEGCEIDPDAALLIARLADGALRDALSLLDQCMGVASHITRSIVQDTAGVTGRDHLADMVRFVLDKDAAAALAEIDRLHQASKDMTRLCEELCEYFRGLMILKTMKQPERILIYPPDELVNMAQQADAMPLSTVLHCLDALSDALQQMRFGNPRVTLEMTMLRITSPNLDHSYHALLRRVEALESREPADQSAKRSIPPAAEPAISVEISTSAALPAPPPLADSSAISAPASTGTLSIEALSEQAAPFHDWPELVEAIKVQSPSVGAALNQSTAYLSGDYLLIDAPQFAFNLLKLPAQRDKMRDVIQQKTGRTYKLGPYKAQKDETPDEADPLERLAEQAQAAGIPVDRLD